jgi:hypothetical protein
MSKLFRVIAVILAVVTLLAPSTTLVQADLQSDGSQIWYFSYDSWGGWTGKMVPLSADVTSGTLKNSTWVFRTDNATTSPVTFPAGDWTLKLHLTPASLNATWAAVAFVYYNGPVLVPVAMDDWKWQLIDHAGEYIFTYHASSGFSVPAGSGLYFGITGTQDAVAGQAYDLGTTYQPADLYLTIDSTNPGNNQLQSPPDPTDPPVPELPAAVLLGIGLVGVMGIVYFRRKFLAS